MWAELKMACSKQWVQTTACRQLPSYSSLSDRSSSVLLLSNGSRYLYCLNDKEGVLLYSCSIQRALRYSSAVLHVGPLLPGSPVTCAVCCLGNGHIVALPLNAIVSRSERPARVGSLSEDIFQALLLTPDRETDSSTPGEHISVTIATSPVSDASLQRAVVIDKKLLVFRTSLRCGHHMLSLFVSGREVSCGGLTVPSFPDPPIREFILSPLACSQPSMSVVPSGRAPMSAVPSGGAFIYKPSILVLSCDSPSSETSTGLNLDLFSQLFGPEISLSRTAVMLVGCENGHILYSGLSQIGGDQLSQGHPRDHLPYLYSLGQPVQSLYAVRLPERVTPELEVMSALEMTTSLAKNLANVLVFVGHHGKIVLCTLDSPQRSTKFQEYHIPGPITSSLLVEGHALFYTTLSNIYRICLSESCVRAACASGKEPAVLIPDEGFRLPESVREVDPGTVLLKSLGVEKSVSNKVFQLLCTTTSGRVLCHTIATKICGEGAMEGDPSSLALELKQCLASMEVSSERLNQLAIQTQRRDSSLVELSTALSLLCDLTELSKGQKVNASSSDSKNCPFLCKCVPCYEEVGVCTHTPCLDVHLVYDDGQTTPLSCGWVLVIQLITESKCSSREDELTSSPRAAVSKMVPLTKLQAGGEVSTRVRILLQPREPLHCTLHCFLHYSPAHLVEEKWEWPCGITPTTVTLPLCQKSFDAVDFLVPIRSAARGMAASPLSFLGPAGPHESDLSESLTLQTSSLADVIQTCTVEDWSKVLLCWLLMRQELTELITNESEEMSIVQLTSHTGCVVSFKSTHLPSLGEVVLAVQGSSCWPGIIVTEFIDCIKRRLSVGEETGSL